MTTPKCLEGVPLVALGAEGPMLYTIVEVNAAVLPLESENAALRAEVARLSTWVDVDYTQGQLFGAHPAVLWTAPCDALLRRDTTHSGLDIQVVAKGRLRWLDKSKRAIYLPITLPGDDNRKDNP